MKSACNKDESEGDEDESDQEDNKDESEDDKNESECIKDESEDDNQMSGRQMIGFVKSNISSYQALLD
ncbi:hypothetical protein RHSIM_Rhsim05G0065300 [Rhododendron simsii]|uniref:Uncharacterized protein n=1 Tax=Rhododendron simsii TaxID=118357 RepID=A0A834H0X7_RHOSS|nr:hypothetical protein RHSIM_Rhsim05G0065300 [Rhododendron simsii]